MKKQIYLSIMLLFSLLLIFSFTANVSAFYTENHNFDTLTAIQETPNSPIISLCAGKTDIILDGNMGADIFVLHYVDNQFMSYIFTHSKQSGYLNCLNYAGTDTDLQCFCYGIGLHITQDVLAHNTGGVVPKYLQSNAASNLIAHMAIENDFQIKTESIYASDPLYTSGKLSQENSRMLSSLFDGTKENNKYIQLLSKISRLPPEQVYNDANTIALGYRQQGFYNTVDKYKTQLPPLFWYASLGVILLGVILLVFGLIIIPKYFGLILTNWKYVFIFLCIGLMLIGSILVVSFYFGNTWGLINEGLRILPIRVSPTDVQSYTQKAISDSSAFLQTGNLMVDDASGLKYRDSITGALHNGSLNNAEWTYTYFLLPYLVILISAFLIFLMFKMYQNKKKSSPGFVKFLGWFVLISFILILLYVIYKIFIAG